MQIKNQFDKESLIKVAKGAGIAGGGVALVYILQAVSSMDFGELTPLVVGLASVLINAIKEYAKGE